MLRFLSPILTKNYLFSPVVELFLIQKIKESEARANLVIKLQITNFCNKKIKRRDTSEI